MEYGEVYVIKFPEVGKDVYKIGYSKDARSRANGLERQYGRSEITFTFSTWHPRSVEDTLQRLFWKKRYKGANVVGRELFVLSKKDLRILKRACKRIEKDNSQLSCHNLPTKGSQSEGAEFDFPESLM